MQPKFLNPDIALSTGWIVGMSGSFWKPVNNSVKLCQTERFSVGIDCNDSSYPRGVV
jgi:hypothetical protein